MLHLSTPLRRREVRWDNFDLAPSPNSLSERRRVHLSWSTRALRSDASSRPAAGPRNEAPCPALVRGVFGIASDQQLLLKPHLDHEKYDDDDHRDRDDDSRLPEKKTNNLAASLSTLSRPVFIR